MNKNSRRKHYTLGNLRNYKKCVDGTPSNRTEPVHLLNKLDVRDSRDEKNPNLSIFAERPCKTQPKALVVSSGIR